MDLITRRYYQPGITVDMAEYQAYCHKCQKGRSVKLQKKTNNILHHIPVQKKIWSHLGMEIMGPFVSVDSYCLEVTVIDNFSKYIKAIPIHQKSAVTFGNFLMCCYCCSDIHITSQGREFINEVMVNYTRWQIAHCI